ncbi:hypothetical protein BT96DRAFT_589161 [Gymnopus androsaceus JB14]|uniref:Uncharacterized protein n=1 Tax=Gymnopus androsaceus JB14 TaxID=1447944 RepID=A0A6A4IB47_9AGAR|nr:hypothetical protein BT96DRAFT_589161 [Gymnopus androsaceus JB14]
MIILSQRSPWISPKIYKFPYTKIIVVNRWEEGSVSNKQLRCATSISQTRTRPLHLRALQVNWPQHPSDDDPLPAPAPVVNDENAYPGANRRRSSVRKSIAASEDMDVTSASAGAFIADDADNSALLDQEMDFDDGDMDMTQTFSSNLQRRSSVGAAIRAPLSQINPSTNQDESLTSEQSFASSDGDRSEPMEFTVPLNRPLRPPANQDEAWLQLVRATHSGEASLAASDDMDSDRPDVEDIVARDNKARYTYNFGECFK